MVDMNYFEKLEANLCPNDCGMMFRLKRPLYICMLCPMEVLDAYYSSTPDDNGNFDNIAIVALCPTCSFVVTQNVKPDHNPGGAGMIYMDTEPKEAEDKGLFPEVAEAGHYPEKSEEAEV